MRLCAEGGFSAVPGRIGLSEAFPALSCFSETGFTTQTAGQCPQREQNHPREKGVGAGGVEGGCSRLSAFGHGLCVRAQALSPSRSCPCPPGLGLGQPNSPQSELGTNPLQLGAPGGWWGQGSRRSSQESVGIGGDAELRAECGGACVGPAPPGTGRVQGPRVLKGSGCGAGADAKRPRADPGAHRPGSGAAGADRHPWEGGLRAPPAGTCTCRRRGDDSGGNAGVTARLATQPSCEPGSSLQL